MSVQHTITISEEMQHSASDSNNNISTSAPEAEPKQHNLLPWKILCLVLALAVALGWVGIIVLLILKDEWQLVFVSWLLFYAAAHFCYWYFRRHAKPQDQSASLRRRLWARLQNAPVVPPQDPATEDLPPSYNDLVKSELPPPAYYSIFKETPKVKRAMRSLPLPWFIKKKALERQDTTASASDNVVTVTKPINEFEISVSPATANVCTVTLSPDQSASVGYDYQTDEMWKSSGGGGPRSDSIVVANISLTNLGGADNITIQLPSYEEMLRAEPGDQPLLTPIHRALAALPSSVTEQHTNELSRK